MGDILTKLIAEDEVGMRGQIWPRLPIRNRTLLESRIESDVYIVDA
jgi:hypothetical protein